MTCEGVEAGGGNDHQMVDRLPGVEAGMGVEPGTHGSRNLGATDDDIRVEVVRVEVELISEDLIPWIGHLQTGGAWGFQGAESTAPTTSSTQVEQTPAVARNNLIA